MVVAHWCLASVLDSLPATGRPRFELRAQRSWPYPLEWYGFRSVLLYVLRDTI